MDRLAAPHFRGGLVGPAPVDKLFAVPLPLPSFAGSSFGTNPSEGQARASDHRRPSGASPSVGVCWHFNLSLLPSSAMNS